MCRRHRGSEFGDFLKVENKGRTVFGAERRSFGPGKVLVFNVFRERQD